MRPPPHQNEAEPPFTLPPIPPPSHLCLPEQLPQHVFLPLPRLLRHPCSGPVVIVPLRRQRGVCERREGVGWAVADERQREQGLLRVRRVCLEGQRQRYRRGMGGGMGSAAAVAVVVRGVAHRSGCCGSRILFRNCGLRTGISVNGITNVSRNTLGGMSSAPPPAVLGALLLLLLFSVSTHPVDSAPAAAVRSPALARSSWPMALGGLYSAQSTDSMAPTSAENIAKNVLFDLNLLDPLSLHYAGPMGGEGDGEGGGSSSYMWASTFTDICKIGRNATDLQVLACYVKPLEAANEDVYHGIYGFVAADGTFFDPNGVRLLALNGEDPSDPRSPVKILAHFEITNMTTGSEGLLEGESFIAMTMSFPPEGQGLEAAHAIFITTRGRVGAVQLVTGPDGSADFVETAVPLLLGGGEEEVSNSVALDEENNVYVVTNAQLYKVRFRPPSSNATVASPGSFEVVWASPYDVLDTPVPGRLSRTGSGSTPSLMMHDGRRYVVISDGDAPQKVLVVDAQTGQVAASRVVDFGQEDINDVFSDQVGVSG